MSEPPLNWSERGRVLGPSLAECHAVVVAGVDPVATAEVALGIARAQGGNRQVAVADLMGEAPPLQALVVGEDQHGIVDSFLFGVSLNKIAHSLPDAEHVFILPTGSAPLDHAEIFGHARWKRLAGGFREVGALLVVVAPVDAAGLRDLVDISDGLIIVGDTVPADIPVAQSLAWLRPRRSGITAVASPPPLAVVEAAEKTRPVATRRWLAGAAGILLSLSLAAAALWFARRPFAGEKPKRALSPTTPAAPAAAKILSSDSLADARRRDSVASAAAAMAAALPDSFPVLPAANAVDSLRASRWGVRLEQTNTRAGAILDLRRTFESVPAGTYGFNDLRTRFLLLVGGAYPTQSGAESLLVQLRAHKILAPENGSVISLPYAFLVQADVPKADVAARLKNFSAKGQPVYALRQPNGTSHLYFGAYETPQQAALAVPTLREAGITPTLVFRIGSVF